jgi:hypothetical protein
VTIYNQPIRTRFFIVFILIELLIACAVSPSLEKKITKKSVTLVWDPPTKNVDGTVLKDLAGYRLYYGTRSGEYPNKIAVEDPHATKHTIYELSPGTYYFVITAYDESGVESVHSNEAVTTVK